MWRGKAASQVRVRESAIGPWVGKGLAHFPCEQLLVQMEMQTGKDCNWGFMAAQRRESLPRDGERVLGTVCERLRSKR